MNVEFDKCIPLPSADSSVEIHKLDGCEKEISGGENLQTNDSNDQYDGKNGSNEFDQEGTVLRRSFSFGICNGERNDMQFQGRTFQCNGNVINTASSEAEEHPTTPVSAGSFILPDLNCDFDETPTTRSEVLHSHQTTQYGDEMLFRPEVLDHSGNKSTPNFIDSYAVGLKPFKCNLCKYATTRTDKLRAHIAKRHTEQASLNVDELGQCVQANNPSIPEGLDVLKPYKCVFCDYASSRRDSLQSHLRRHTGDKPYACDACGATFAVKQSLQVHIRARHTGEKPFKCEVCNASFAQKGQLKSHSFVHMAGKQFICEECGCAFARKSNLQVHYRVHSDEKPFKCDHCGAAFSHKNYLRVHARVHTGERPYKCEACGSAFATKCNLQTHIKTHSGLKPFKCAECNGSFASKGDLQTHLHLHTGEKPYKCLVCGSSFALKHYLTSHARTHTQEKPHICEYCGARFTARGTLRTHWRIHAGETPHKCTVCNASFGTRNNLRVHMVMHKRKVLALDLVPHDSIAT